MLNHKPLIFSEMEELKYKVIATQKQYKEYSKLLNAFLLINPKTRQVRDEIALLTLLIETWESGQTVHEHLNPVELLKYLMQKNSIKAVQLASLLNISGSMVSDMLNYKKGFSKESIRILSEHFKLKQEAFNRPYQLRSNQAVAA